MTDGIEDGFGKCSAQEIFWAIVVPLTCIQEQYKCRIASNYWRKAFIPSNCL